MQLKEPKTAKEFKLYFLFRWEMLRKPYNQSFGSEKDEYENDSFHLMIMNNKKKVVGIGRVHQIRDLENDTCAQIRYMAVSKIYRKQGLGKKILKKLEKYAYNQGINKIILHARENAIDFYIKNGYKINHKSHILFDSIQHWMMGKTLN